ncbi:rRNA cytosine-C5-methyltransferase [Paenibacillus beijingensis]|uniref:rRNA cytosine-C5-methyltransferase n=2 Tax=Paenibacillus beijingensis TaxID=1126833 RepID=A0A0D5NEL4_9BACL|nr:RsmB/NOP family class I SAM-dependent RNA methyltransferase [Paenibacillus beijingensis]AJY73358.1 rRNA cytosine-C5-methyltransferase [Paenibacillus beijingensis]
MAPRLPQLFLDKMEHLLGAEFPAFIASYGDSRLYGLRINSLKLTSGSWRDINPFGEGEGMPPIPWTAEGYYYDEKDRPGKHPYYHAGLYYIQEPSAMVPVELLGVRPGDRVLDLCAAPGGKSTQIAAKLQGRGVLVSNDNARERTKALAKNIELAGVRNAVVLNEEPHRLADTFAGWFDRILVDAPCSGEGMFRKEESMIAEWEKHSVERCSAMQRDILRHAAAMLAPGGTLVYSTCTFSPEENECAIARLLAEFPELEVVPVEARYGWMPGRPEWAAEYGTDAVQTAMHPLAGTVRLWPHRVKGEGHYAAVLTKRRSGDDQAGRVGEDGHDGRKRGSGERALNAEPRDRRRHGSGGKAMGSGKPIVRGPERSSGRYSEPLRKAAKEEADPLAQWQRFAEENLTAGAEFTGVPVVYGTRVYLQPEEMPSLDGLKVVRAGWFVGEAGSGGKFQPSQPLAMGLKAADAVRWLNFRADEPETLRFLRGETLHPDAERMNAAIPAVSDGGSRGGKDELRGKFPAETVNTKGYTLVCVDGYPLGWGKYSGGMLKNGLPAGWRRM